ncbi:DEAD/DEAH box helicase [Clostridium sp. 19966]|uniref:exonuclease domain-containing protein n=1 Tax=Clostridium sp. 19966 TaxID=2768166 RepID=UPI0028DDA4FA|nr:exonuclease domain-containing protein [Clostridium sp. 19966]MDT8716945.1 DEAD/DEAH box helicase [Clostridium sp. 19966]
MEPYSILNNLVFLDIETTGIDPNKDKIIEIGAVKIINNEVTRFTSLVNPNIQVPLNIFDLCRGITQEELEEAPQLGKVMEELLLFIEERPLVCHNSGFEKSFLKVKNEFLDSLELVAILYPELPEFNLQYLIKRFLPAYKEEIHRGLSDSEDTVKVLNYVISSFYEENGYILPMSITELSGWSWYKYLQGINMEVVKQFVEDRPITFQRKLEEPYPVFALKHYEKLFEQQEIWKRNGRSYTLRPQQKEASKFIRQGLEKGKITIMEAPTGLGKSMAYLLPSAIYSHLKQEKIIVSTNTKSLQNQLVDKDIPNLLEALDLKSDVNYTLMKGKNNYLCFDRFEDIEYPEDMQTLIGYIYLKRLMTEKGFGDSEEINYAIREKLKLNPLIEQCLCDAELCDVDVCKYKDSCYYASKVTALAEAQLIVVNHSLLLKWPYQNIVPLENIIVDEAHNLTQEAYDAFQSSIISYELEKFVSDIYNSKNQKGYLYYLAKRTQKDKLPLEEMEAAIAQCINQARNIGAAFEKYIVSFGISRDYNIKEHLNKGNAKLAGVIKYVEYLKEDLKELNRHLDAAVATLKEVSTLEKDKRLKILIEKVETINAYTSLIENMLLQSEEDCCFYYEVDKNFNWWKLSMIPLDVSGAFYEKVLSGIKSCLFISATLSTDNGYNNLKNTLGINIAKSENKEIIDVPPIEPVFDYKGKSAVYAVDGFDPNDAEGFAGNLKLFLLELLNNVDGNIIMLFTSRKRLEAFREEAEMELNSLGIRLVQGKKDVEKLKSRKDRYILLGSKGYFEGIDIPGDAMTTVILDKVPNINSKEPFYKSLIDNSVEGGKNYWRAYAEVNFPIVSIDLKQIYGRLIRTEYDYGALFIMSKFDANNSTVKRLENQLHGVPVIRKGLEGNFMDLSLRTIRWKQINLYKIMKEVQKPLKRNISEKKKNKEINSLKETEEFINAYMEQEYEKRKLNYDAKIILGEEASIYIRDRKLNLGANKENINKYFKDIV